MTVGQLVKKSTLSVMLSVW